MNMLVFTVTGFRVSENKCAQFLVGGCMSDTGAAVFSAIIFNPLDVAMTRLQAQVGQKTPAIRPDRYMAAFDAFCKIIRQEGLYRPWRGISVALTLDVPTVGLFNTI
jgi:hypothetical protein